MFARLAVNLTVLSVSILAASGAASAATVSPPPLPLPAAVNSLLGTGQPASDPAGSAQSSATPSAAVRIQRPTGLESAIAGRMNAVRAAHGLRRLALSAQLTRAARAHATVLAESGFFAHEWSDGTPFASWIVRYYPASRTRVWLVAENLEWSTAPLDPQQAVDRWLASPEHRRNLLGKQWRQIGLGVLDANPAPGVYGGQDVVIAAAEFGVRR